MRHVRTATVGAGVALLLAACSSSTSTPAASSPAGVATTAPAAPATHPGVGASQTLKFAGGTATMAVLKLVDPAMPTQGKENPGIRDVAVQIKVVDNGPAAFRTGTMMLLAFDADGQNLEEHSEWPTSAGPELDTITGVNAAAGDTQSGFVTFMVPTGAKIARLQYTPPGGTAIEWALG